VKFLEHSARKASGQQSLDTEETGVSHTINHRHRRLVTFKGGQEKLAHRWFRLTPSFSPDLVVDILERFGNKEARVLDPFSGRGTTPIECQLRNIPCVGVEINPALYFAASTSLKWNVSPERLEQQFKSIVRNATALIKKYASLTPESLSETLGVPLPRIHNVYRWWRADVLRDLLVIKHAILNTASDPDERDLLLLALMSILLDTANITLGRLQLHFIDRSADAIEPLALYKTSSSVIIEDLKKLSANPPKASSKIYLGDNRLIADQIGDFRANLVITSPPYPNRYSYVWNTRPHLYFMQWFSTPTEAAALDCKTIGGTWGTATSRHQKGCYEYSHDAVESVVSDVVAQIRKSDLLMSNYVAMYFDDLYKSISETKKSLVDGAVCAYVVGNSRMKGTIVETDHLLAKLFDKLGFELLGNEEIRRRNSGKELHETIVFAKARLANNAT
jgi:hypothetical protein